MRSGGSSAGVNEAMEYFIAERLAQYLNDRLPLIYGVANLDEVDVSKRIAAAIFATELLLGAPNAAE